MDNLFCEVLAFVGSFEWMLAVGDEETLADVSRILYQATVFTNCPGKTKKEFQLRNIKVVF